jgi:hypothetical protein
LKFGRSDSGPRLVGTCREAQRQQYRGRRQNVQAAGVQQRVAEAAAAEADKMAAFKALLAQGPIQIPKRQ